MIFLQLVTLLTLLELASAEKKLILVHGVWRHGSRTHVSQRLAGNMTDWFKKEDFQGPGELIQRGIKQKYEFGELMRQMYQEDVKFVSPHYIRKEIYMRSSDFNRTIMSASIMLAGFYAKAQPKPASRIPKGWYPVPVHMVPRHKDGIVYNWDPCPMADEILQDLFDRNIITTPKRRPKSTPKPKIGLMLAKTDLDYEFDGSDDENDSNDAENNDQSDDPKPKPKPKPKFYLSYGERMRIEAVRRYYGAGLIGDIAKRMLQKRDSIQNPNKLDLKWVRDLKFYGYSGHDYTVISALTNLWPKLTYEYTSPKYSACLLFEMWQDGDKFTVNIKYRHDSKSEITDFIPVRVEGCDLNCTIDQFYDQIKDHVPTDLVQECRLPETTPTTTSPTKSTTPTTTSPNTTAIKSDASIAVINAISGIALIAIALGMS